MLASSRPGWCPTATQRVVVATVLAALDYHGPNDDTPESGFADTMEMRLMSVR